MCIRDSIENAQGCNVRYGIAPDKLYQSWLVYDADEVTLSTLMAGQTYYAVSYTHLSRAAKHPDKTPAR